MSCGNHHDTDCAEVLAEVWLFLDHECDRTRREVLARHSRRVWAVPGRVRPGGEAEEAAGHEVRRDKAPDRLREQIRVAVLKQAAITVESGPDGVTTTTVEVRSTRIERTS